MLLTGYLVLEDHEVQETRRVLLLLVDHVDQRPWLVTQDVTDVCAVRLCSSLHPFETMASVIHHGSFSTLNQAYNAILKWIEANGYHISGPTRELNLEYERGGDQSKFVSEIQFPVEKR